MDGKKFTTESPLRRLSINRKNGLITGSMVVDNKTQTFKGVVNQGEKTGAGQVNIKGLTARMELLKPAE